MNIQKVIQGTDFLQTIKIVDDSGNFIPLGTMSDYQAYIYNISTSGQVQLKYTYKMTPTPGSNDYQIAAVDTLTQGILLNRTQTAIMQPGIYYLESKYSLPSANFYISSLQVTGNHTQLCEIIPSANSKSLL
jgi:hypothetical protein